jgi:hypothetical protein
VAGSSWCLNPKSRMRSGEVSIMMTAATVTSTEAAMPQLAIVVMLDMCMIFMTMRTYVRTMKVVMRTYVRMMPIVAL